MSDRQTGRRVQVRAERGRGRDRDRGLVVVRPARCGARVLTAHAREEDAELVLSVRVRSIHRSSAATTARRRVPPAGRSS